MISGGPHSKHLLHYMSHVVSIRKRAICKRIFEALLNGMDFGTDKGGGNR